MNGARAILVIGLLLCCPNLDGAAGTLVGATTADVKVRSSPNGPQVDSLSVGTALALVGYKDGWVQVGYLARQSEVKHGWISARYVRATSNRNARVSSTGVSGDHCDSEAESGAEVCVTVSNAALDCDEHYSGRYYESCEVSVDYEVSTDYEGDDSLDVDVQCDVEISYSGPKLYVQGSDSDSQSDNHTLYADGSESNSMSFDFAFGFLQQATKVDIESATCEVTNINLG